MPRRSSSGSWKDDEDMFSFEDNQEENVLNVLVSKEIRTVLPSLRLNILEDPGTLLAGRIAVLHHGHRGIF